MTSLSVKFHVWDIERIRQIVSESGGLDSGFYIEPIRIMRVNVPEEADPDEIIAALRGYPEVERVNLSGKVYRRTTNYHAATNDELLDTQWNLKRINAFHAWKYTMGDPSVKIFIVDSGIMDFPDTAGIVDIANSWDCEQNAPGFSDTHYAWYDPYEDVWYNFSHGTVLAEIIKGNTNNSHGLAGLAPNCTLGMCVFHYDQAEGTGDAGAAADSLEAVMGIVKAVDLGARIINCSWGLTSFYPMTAEEDPFGPVPGSNPPAGYNGSYSPQLYAAMQDTKDAIDYALAHDVIFSWAAGNADYDAAGYKMIFDPTVGAYTYPWPIRDFWFEHPDPRVVGVSRTTINDKKSNESSGYGTAYGPLVDIVAPATQIPTLGPTDSQPPQEWFHYAWGCSYAAPQVAAVMGLVLSINPSLSGQQVVDIVTQNTDDFREITTKDWFPNAGMLNAAKAVLKALATVPANAGNIYPYVNFWSVTGTAPVPTYGQTCTVPGPEFNGAAVTTIGSGVAATTLNGNIIIEIRGYSSDPISSIELWIGGVKLYDGPPNLLSATASNSGAAAEIKVVVRTATGFAEEIYSDIVVTSITNIVSLRAFFPQSLSSQSTIGNIVLSSSSVTVLYPANMDVASQIGNVTLWSLDNLTLYPDALSCDAQIGQIGLTPGPTFSVAGMASDSEIDGITLQTIRLPSLRKWDGVAWSDAILKNSLGMIITPKRYIDGQWQ